MTFRHWILCIAAVLSLSAALGFLPRNSHPEAPGYELTRSLHHTEAQPRDALL
ncbi:hypothetical protein PVT71_01805 [Salipiger sp. H15]|uniref:Uncharacterized protein n=1 Tax=Alloyangia sp. H15 TaxID=3029062 RepID=A0AAU8AHR1_9RHOB